MLLCPVTCRDRLARREEWSGLLLDALCFNIMVYQREAYRPKAEVRAVTARAGGRIEKVIKKGKLPAHAEADASPVRCCRQG